MVTRHVSEGAVSVRVEQREARLAGERHRPSLLPTAYSLLPHRSIFLAVVATLLALGLVMVYSASITARPTDFEEIYLSRQLMFLLVAMTAGTTAFLVPAKYWLRWAPLLQLGVLGLLVVVLIPGVGTEVNGARRWLRFGGMSLQPSEFAKITLVLLVTSIVRARRPIKNSEPSPSGRRQGEGTHGDAGSPHPQPFSRGERGVLSLLRRNGWWPTVTSVAFVTSIPAALVFLQPDLGTALFLVLASAIVLWMSGCPLRYFIAAGVAALPMAMGLMFLRPYQWQRIQGFLATWSDASQAPYQVKQSLTSLGVGGTNGVGLGGGLQKLSFLPEANTDFVFAVIGEELGLVGTLGVVLLWITLVVCGFHMIRGLRVGSPERTVATTLLTLLALQSVINMCVVTALVPPKGISQPLVSYGGSSLVSSLVGIGIVLSLCRGDERLARQ